MASPNKVKDKKGAKAMTQGNDKEFWINLGMKIGENLECSKSLNERFDKFLTNDHVHLEQKVDKITNKIAYIVGGITALSWGLQFILKLWK